MRNRNPNPLPKSLRPVLRRRGKHIITPLQRQAVARAVHKLKATDWESISPTHLANLAGVKKQTAFRWLRDPILKEHFNKLMSLKGRKQHRVEVKRRAIEIKAHKNYLTEEGKRLAAEDDQITKRVNRANKFIVAKTQDNKRVWSDFLKTRWKGPTLSLDGSRIIGTPQEYLEHILEKDPTALPYEVVEEIRAVWQSKKG